MMTPDLTDPKVDSIHSIQGSTFNPKHSVIRHQLSGTLCLQLLNVPLPSPLSSHIWKLNCSLLHTTRSNISSAAGASNSNFRYTAAPIIFFDVWHFDIWHSLIKPGTTVDNFRLSLEPPSAKRCVASSTLSKSWKSPCRDDSFTSARRDISTTDRSTSLVVEEDEDLLVWNGSSVDGGGDVVDVAFWLDEGLTP